MIPQNQHLDLISSLSFLGSKPCPLLPFLKFKWFLNFQTFMNMFPQKQQNNLISLTESNMLSWAIDPRLKFEQMKKWKARSKMSEHGFLQPNPALFQLENR